MMKLYNEHTIATHWACALFYGDYSGLTDSEIDQVEAFIKKLPDGYTLDIPEEEAAFSTDEISGLMANCTELKVFVWSNQVE